ncbi:hypothetical protein [Tellurirhabdus bombi]|uniref:hypothetical protein n=1 Tax=Tellurirhabdus bombi TaxID=2907205 RepID=UPI001F28684B|nr:hypothetical protein [Tellurirhabdus bombi]
MQTNPNSTYPILGAYLIESISDNFKRFLTKGGQIAENIKDLVERGDFEEILTDSKLRRFRNLNPKFIENMRADNETWLFVVDASGSITSLQFI